MINKIFTIIIMLKSKNNNLKIKTRYAVNFRYNPNTRKRILAKQAKAGKCLFPFKISKHTDPKQYDCVKAKDNSSWCATKVKPNLLKEEWGFCVPEGMTQEEYIESISKPKKKLILKCCLAKLWKGEKCKCKFKKKTKNNNRSKLKKRIAVNFRYNPKNKKKILSRQAKGGDCIFPFKISKHADPKQYDCVKGEEDSSWCATEIKPNLMKTKWGYCVPEGMTLEEYNSLYEN